MFYVALLNNGSELTAAGYERIPLANLAPSTTLAPAPSDFGTVDGVQVYNEAEILYRKGIQSIEIKQGDTPVIPL